MIVVAFFFQLNCMRKTEKKTKQQKFQKEGT